MTSRTTARLARLEQASPDIPVVVYCSDRDEIAATIAHMIAAGDMQPEDRNRAMWVFDLDARPPGTRAHEEALDVLLERERKEGEHSAEPIHHHPKGF